MRRQIWVGLLLSSVGFSAHAVILEDGIPQEPKKIPSWTVQGQLNNNTAYMPLPKNWTALGETWLRNGSIGKSCAVMEVGVEREIDTQVGKGRKAAVEKKGIKVVSSLDGFQEQFSGMLRAEKIKLTKNEEKKWENLRKDLEAYQVVAKPLSQEMKTYWKENGFVLTARHFCVGAEGWE